MSVVRYLLFGVGIWAIPFLFGPFLTPPADYFADIGLTYAMIPLIAGFVGLALRR